MLNIGWMFERGYSVETRDVTVERAPEAVFAFECLRDTYQYSVTEFQYRVSTQPAPRVSLL